MDNLNGIVRLLKKEQDRLTTELRGIGAALAAFGHTYAKGTGTRKLSAAARARIAAAQRALWSRARVAAEPGGAAAFSALLSRRYVPKPDEKVGVVVSGGNTNAVNFS